MYNLVVERTQNLRVLDVRHTLLDVFMCNYIHMKPYFKGTR